MFYQVGSFETLRSLSGNIISPSDLHLQEKKSNIELNVSIVTHPSLGFFHRGLKHYETTIEPGAQLTLLKGCEVQATETRAANSNSLNRHQKKGAQKGSDLNAYLATSPSSE